MSKLNVPVLVVDDQALMRKIVRKLLSHIGFTRITDVADGQEALNTLRTAPHGLVISDWNMDTMSGLELLGAVRSDPKLKDLPFILATAEGKPEHVMAAKEAGANGYIIKPFDADSLRSKIESVLGAL